MQAILEKIEVKEKQEVFENKEVLEDKEDKEEIKIKNKEEIKDKVMQEARFEDMNLHENLLRGILSYGYEKPSTIQAKSIIPLYLGNDIIAQAQSGTGKSAAFIIGSLQRIDTKIKKPQVIILSHTRELAEQTYEVCKKLSHYMKDIVSLLCTGGTSVSDTKSILDNLKTSSFIVVGTPGRLNDLVQRRILDISCIKTVILDEADELLSVGFTDQVKQLITQMPNEMQLCLFSATMPDYIFDLASKFMKKNVIKILVKHDELTLEGISQYYVNIEHDKFKPDMILDLYNMITISQSLIYVASKQRAEDLKVFLEKNNFTTDIIHSGLDYNTRRSIMQKFRSGKIRVLVSTDLLSRGIDVQQVSIVINYDLPQNKEAYIHRIGRSGRFGRKGVAINIVTNRDKFKLIDLEKFYCTQILELPNDVENILKNM
jgi:translation initiation factor 4A